MSVIDRIDRFQRSHPVLGFPLAVFYKFQDDQGPYLSAIISYYGFIAIFPLLLIATSVLGFLLQGNKALQDRLLDSVLAQFPIVGDELGRPDAITGSASGIVIGSIVALYGAMGVGQAIQNAANVAWAVPRNARPHPILQRLLSLLMAAIAGFGALAVAVAISVITDPADVGLPLHIDHITVVVRVLGLLIWTLIFMVLFRVLSLKRATWRAVLPGAVTTSLCWQLLQLGGDAYVRHVIVRASSMNQTFAVVLGLVAFIFIAANLLVLGLEVNVVLRRRLYPRALLAPFTDNVRLGASDLRAYTSYVRMQRHKGFQHIEVEYAGDGPESASEDDQDSTPD